MINWYVMICAPDHETIYLTTHGVFKTPRRSWWSRDFQKAGAMSRKAAENVVVEKRTIGHGLVMTAVLARNGTLRVVSEEELVGWALGNS